MADSTEPATKKNDILLAEIAYADQVNSDWNELRNAIKEKLEKNISLFLETTQKPPFPAPYAPMATHLGGLKLAPFPPRPANPLNSNDAPPCYMNQEETNAMKDVIFAQLDQFEGSPPFTIQRLCELCVEPQRQYKSVGKYLRAVEKSILVTSTWDSFPPLTQSEIHSAGRSAIMLGSTLQSAPSTPLFSPISFLHDDVRRSKSRSPPPTPLSLNPTVPSGAVQSLGLVDELDDPSPGHMSDHPTALSSVTTITDIDLTRPLFELLGDRFVKGETYIDELEAPEFDGMEMDEDKENTKA